MVCSVRSQRRIWADSCAENPLCFAPLGRGSVKGCMTCRFERQCVDMAFACAHRL